METASFEGTTQFSEDIVSWSVVILGVGVSGPLAFLSTAVVQF